MFLLISMKLNDSFVLTIDLVRFRNFNVDHVLMGLYWDLQDGQNDSFPACDRTPVQGLFQCGPINCMTNLLLLVLLILYPGLGCVKTCDVPTNSYWFVLPHAVTPAKAEFKVGDTISVTADFPHEVMEANGNSYLLEDFNFQLTFVLIDLLDSNVSTSVRAFSHCEIMLEDDTRLYLDQFGPIGEYNYEAGRYHLRFKFRPMKSGFYAFVQNSLTSTGAYSGISRDFPGKCGGNLTRAKARVEVNNGADNNYHLLQDDHVMTYTHQWISVKKIFHEDGVFLFYVED